jgi:hypothetical protein
MSKSIRVYRRFDTTDPENIFEMQKPVVGIMDGKFYYLDKYPNAMDLLKDLEVPVEVLKVDENLNPLPEPPPAP